MSSDLEWITTWEAFRERLQDPERGPVACRLGGELLPFEWAPVDPLELLSQAIDDPKARLLRQPHGDRLDLSADFSREIRALPAGEAAREPYLHLSLFDLSDLRRPGRALHRLGEELMRPMEQLWRERGMRWEGDFWPILFLGGSRSATNYHFDPTPNVTLHLFGAKRFHSLREPDRWRPQAEIDAYYREGIVPPRPTGIPNEEILIHDNAPGDLVWIPLHTPHWVDAGSLSATITFAFRQFRMGG